MGQVLYRKYRPKKLVDVVGQEHITKTLEQALKQGRISHAYLFTGPHGVGKTSVARILAHEINKLPYNEDGPHLDIIEIDAASNRRIDEIRELRDKVHIAPAIAKYKVYIIDEVHMLTREAFNALLKTLEEPPVHTVFILATTEAHKLPDTIVSRTQRFSFKPIEVAKVSAYLSDIAKQEGIKIDSEALQLLAEHGAGSFRDSISLLDQVSGRTKEVDRDEVLHLLGIPPDEAVEQLLNMVGQFDLQGIAHGLNEMYAQGYRAALVAKKIAAILRQQLLDGNPALAKDKTLDLLGRLIEVPASHDPESLLEIILLEPAVAQFKAKTDVAPASNVAGDEIQDASKAQDVPQEKDSPEVKMPETQDEARPKQQKVAKKQPLGAAVWPEILNALKKKYNTLYGVVRMAEPAFTDDGTLILTFAFAFHARRISDAKNRQALSEIINDFTDKAPNIECRIDKNISKVPAAEQKLNVSTTQDDPVLTAISSVFGGGELLD